MDAIVDYLFGAASFIPHGYCLLWRPDLVAIHAFSDIVIAISYFTIPIGIMYFVRQRKDFGYKGVFWCFAAFIVACGVTHIAGLVMLWQPYYGLQGLIKLGTAIISAVTAYLIWPIIPHALALPSPAALTAVNRELEQKISENQAVNSELRAVKEGLEERVKERTLELTSANEKLNRYTYIASHDLQEPLRKIVVFADILEAAIESGHRDDIAYARGAIKESALRARALVADLLDLSRASHSHFATELVSVPQVVEMVLNDQADEIRSVGAEISTDIGAALIRADRTKFTILLQNMIGNALKYRKPNERPRIEICSRVDDRGLLVLSIADNGIGFDAQYETAIFEPFVRLHKVGDYPGTGIGLAICAEIAARHGWEIASKGRIGIGATLTLRIPLEQSVTETSRSVQADAPTRGWQVALKAT